MKYLARRSERVYTSKETASRMQGEAKRKAKSKQGATRIVPKFKELSDYKTLVAESKKERRNESRIMAKLLKSLKEE